MAFLLGERLLRRAVLRVYTAEQRLFDAYLGVSTRGVSYTDTDKFHADTENWPYLGCQWPAFPLVLRSLPHDGTFVDLGSGKGKALLIAARAPYRRVIGVEIDPDLASVARRNIARLGRRRRAGVLECVTASVTEWEIPDDTSVVFLHNPFFGETFRHALRNVFASYDRNPRDLRIVYMFPWEHDWLLSTGRVDVERVRPEGWPRLPRWWASEHVTVIYRVTAAGAEPAAPGRPQSRRVSASEERALRRWKTPAAHRFRIGIL